MDTIDLHERFNEIKHILSQRASSPVPPYWFYNDADLSDVDTDMDIDEAMSYCLECIRVIKPDAEIGEHYGGGGADLADNCVFCNRCGKLLDYCLTDEGLEYELTGFEERLAEGCVPDLGSPDICYQLVNIAGDLRDDERRKRFMAICEGDL